MDFSEAISIKHIKKRDDIPLLEKHVVVMWGLSTRSFTHLLGTTFVVNNSRYHSTRDIEFQEALAAAKKLALTQELTLIYLLD